MKADNLKSDQ